MSSTHVGLAVRVSPDRPDRPLQASVRRLRSGDLALVDAECDPCSGTRGRARMRGAELDYVVVLITRSGRESVSQDNAGCEMRPGEAVIWDSSRPVRFQVWEPNAWALCGSRGPPPSRSPSPEEDDKLLIRLAADRR